MRYISELRFGPPMTFKTGSVVGTYPKPLLVLLFDRHGLEIFQKPIVRVSPGKLAKFVESPDIPPVSAIDFSEFRVGDIKLTEQLGPRANATALEKTVEVVNFLRRLGDKIPFKTVVLDSVTELSNVIYEYVGSIGNEKTLMDSRKWAGQIGGMTKQIFDAIHLFKCHTVCIAHSEKTTSETGAIVNEEPMMYSRLREYVQAMFSQTLYQSHDGSRAFVTVSPFGYVRGIGCKWPRFSQTTIPADFDSIYGKVNFTADESAEEKSETKTT